jgi:hypothetical protein
MTHRKTPSKVGHLMRTHRVLGHVILILIVCLIVTACVPSVEPGGHAPETEPAPTKAAGSVSPSPTMTLGNTPEVSPPDPIEQRVAPTLVKLLETVQPTHVIPVIGEVPGDLLDEIMADLANKEGLGLQSIEVIRAEAVTWNDGSLGCPQPGMMYTQALVDGYWVILQAEGIDYDYRVSDTGYFILCEGRGMLPIPPPGGPGSGLSPDN